MNGYLNGGAETGLDVFAAMFGVGGGCAVAWVGWWLGGEREGG